MSRRIKAKENKCTFRLKEIGLNLEGPHKGKQKEIGDVLKYIRPKVAQRGPSRYP